MKYCDVSKLIGKTLQSVEIMDTKECIIFKTTDEKVYAMFHSQDCCESVYVEDVNGDWEDLIDVEMQYATEETHNPKDTSCESCTYTFYKFGTSKGYLDIRWFGSSNGYYSEEVQFAELENLDDIKYL
jgi:hypothetical protein